MPEELTTLRSAPAPPLALTPREPDPPLWRRPLVLALLVLVAGAALGAAGFVAEQRYVVWHPKITETGDGWRIAGGPGSHPVAPAIAGDRLAWGQSLFTCVMELATGKEKTIGFASPETSIWPPAVNDRYVAWIESPKTRGRSSVVWVYDTRTGRRVGYTAPADAGPAALADNMAVWYQNGAPARIVGLDLASGGRSTLFASSELDYATVLASGHYVGWLLAPSQGGLTVELNDTDTGRTVDVVVDPPNSGYSIGDLQFSGGHLVWTQQGNASSRILDYDVETGTTTTVAQGEVERPATDGSTIVWATASATGSGATVMGVRTAGGGPFTVVRIAGWPNGGLAVGGDWVAWTAADGRTEYLQTGRLPQ